MHLQIGAPLEFALELLVVEFSASAPAGHVLHSITGTEGPQFRLCFALLSPLIRYSSCSTSIFIIIKGHSLLLTVRDRKTRFLFLSIRFSFFFSMPRESDQGKAARQEGCLYYDYVSLTMTSALHSAGYILLILLSY